MVIRLPLFKTEGKQKMKNMVRIPFSDVVRKGKLHKIKVRISSVFVSLLKEKIIPFVFPVFSSYYNPFYVSLEQQSPRHGTEDAKGELNVSTQNSTFSHISRIKHCTMQDYYVIKTENRLYASQSTQV